MAFSRQSQDFFCPEFSRISPPLTSKNAPVARILELGNKLKNVCLSVRASFYWDSMTTTHGLPRWLLIYGLILPLAVFLGYLVAIPTTFVSVVFVSAVILLLAFPLFLRWHHAWVIFCWNAALIFYFAPGQPNLGIILAAGSLMLSVL